MDLAVAGNDARQAQNGLLAAAINTAAHLEDSATNRPDNEVFNQHGCRLFLGKPAYRYTGFV